MAEHEFPTAHLTRSPGLAAVKHLAAIAALQAALGPFDSLHVMYQWTPGEGWTSATVTALIGEDEWTQHLFASGDLCTDPCYLHIEALGTFALAWHEPPLFASLT